jgi:hypothetical protein
MDFNANLPVIVPGVVALIVVSAAAAFVLAWSREARIRLIVRRAWIACVALIVLGVVAFFVSTLMVEGPRHGVVDRTLQHKQHDELQQRLKDGGH